ncbi:hypothetical protein POM88_042623 [Heracleum sosnowskyi]|uniref:Uncharacterized protein n=1 Tax=Heracleum sosnowskyi TaxID=360622 RepID=A0AAD8HIY8_9APIA|nr:hypothetical protein POM88_042623 [Heracleum sosnowskyi]
MGWPNLKFSGLMTIRMAYYSSTPENFKECEEEAGIVKSIASQAIPVGVVSYMDIDGYRYKRDVLFCYDLKLPESFVPKNQDGVATTAPRSTYIQELTAQIKQNLVDEMEAEVNKKVHQEVDENQSKGSTKFDMGS